MESYTRYFFDALANLIHQAVEMFLERYKQDRCKEN